MQKYFIHDGHKQLGPFSAAELRYRNVTRCTPVKAGDQNNYVTACEIPELNELLKNSPATGKGTTTIQPFKKSLAWLIATAVIISGSFILYNQLHTIPDSAAVSDAIMHPYSQDNNLPKAAAAANDATDAAQFLAVHGKMHNNLSGKKIIKGSITDIAGKHGYKDLQIAVTFLSSSQAELQTQRIFVNDSVKINSSISFRNVLKAPEETTGFRLKILSATPLQ
jgi:predicted hotdog family 3-hydroxylacyl-ACP dehydratase